MSAISDTFSRNHKECDDSWATAEELASRGKWPEATSALQRFLAAMRIHFGVEETTLFPAFEDATGMSGGPTAVMRMEHAQMQDLFAELERAVTAKDAEAFAGAGETLLILMQQHNLKEENMLYPMCDRALSADGRLIDKLLSGLQGR